MGALKVTIRPDAFLMSDAEVLEQIELAKSYGRPDWAVEIKKKNDERKKAVGR
jgi:hypothetical protein